MAIEFSHPCTGTANTALTTIAPDVGSNLVSVSGDLRTNGTGTKARRTAGSGGQVVRTNQTIPSADYTVRATVNLQSTGDASAIFRLYARLTDGNNHYVLQWFSNSLLVRSVASGTQTTIGSSVSWTPTTGVDYVYELIVSGSLTSVKRDGSTISGLGGTDTTYSAALNAGWSIAGTGASDPDTTGWILDDLQVETAAPSGPSPAVLAFFLR